MALKQPEEENQENIMISEREEFVINLSNPKIPTFRNAHFLKPFANPTNQPHSEPPFLSPSSNPNSIQKLSKMVVFRGWSNPNDAWESWVNDLINIHQSIWKKVGIFDAIKCSTYNIKKDNELIIELGQKWCVETNTFIFSWGECSITLEDIMILGGFPVLGVSVLTPCQRREFDEIEGVLVNSCSVIRSVTNNLVTHNGWMKHFKGKGGELEHVAFLVLWLSRFVFPTDSYNIIATNAFAIAISLAKGTNIALAHAVLASIYRDLTLLKGKIVTFVSEGQDDGAKLVVSAPFQLVQVWAWERFTPLRPKPTCLSPGEPRFARWHGARKLRSYSLRLQDVESDGNAFLWRPYALELRNWLIPKFYCDQEMWVLVDYAVDDQLLSYVKCLMACDLVGVDCMELYLPHRLGMQFGMDQDIPHYILSLNADLELALSSYEKSLDGLKFYLPPRLFKGEVTINYYNWWWRALSRKYDSLSIHEREMYEIPIRCSPCIEAIDLGSPPRNSWVTVNDNRPDIQEVAFHELYDAANIHEKQMSEIPIRSPSCIEAIDLGSPPRNSRVAVDEHPPDFQEVAFHEPYDVANEHDLVGATEILEGLEEDTGKTEHNAMEEDTKNVMESEFKLGVGRKHSKDNSSQNEPLSVDHEIMCREELLLGTERSIICSMLAALEQSEAANQDADIKLVGNPVLISDEEEDISCYPIEDKSLEFEARITRLEKMVSALKIAKFGPSV